MQKKEKIEKSLAEIEGKINALNEKYADKRKALDDTYAAEVKIQKEKEKLLKAKLKEMETAEKMKLVSKIPFETLRKIAKDLEKDKAAVEEKRNSSTSPVSEQNNHEEENKEDEKQISEN